MPQTKYLSTGEFAKIMNTTKETLFHYEEITLGRSYFYNSFFFL